MKVSQAILFGVGMLWAGLLYDADSISQVLVPGICGSLAALLAATLVELVSRLSHRDRSVR